MKTTHLLAALTCFTLATSLPSQAQWSDQQKHLITTIQPTDTENSWLKINWRTNLWEARKEAAKSKKPIYLWEMDGHPLGCT